MNRTSSMIPTFGAIPSAFQRMKKQIKGGYLLRYAKGWLWKSWREEWVVLYEDSTLAWYKDKDTKYPRGSVRLCEAPDLIAISEWTLQVPCRPHLPPDCSIRQLIALGNRRQTGKVHWLLTQSQDEVNDWMIAFTFTLPPPPRYTFDHNKYDNPQRQLQHSGNGSNQYNVDETQDYQTSDTNYHSFSSNARNGVCNSRNRNCTNCSTEDCASGTMMVGVAVNWGHGMGWSSWNTENGATDLAGVYASESGANHITHTSTHEYDTGTGLDDIGSTCFGDFGF